MTGTKTSSFGSSKRENHDSTEFYDSRLYNNLNVKKKASGLENPVPDNLVNSILHQDARDMSSLPDESIHLVVTSPGYNVGKDYDDDLSLLEYLQLLEDVFAECYRTLVDGGRMVINIANVGRKPYIPLHGYIIEIMLKLGFQMRGEIIWDKGASAGSSTAWGSWMSASNPVLRDVHEYLLVFSKGGFSRSKTGKESTVSRDEFLEFTKSVWQFNTVSAKKIGHPAPFPVELPYRCIQLYSFENDIVLDPFMGSGSTAIAALKSKRRYVGFDTEEEYIDLAKDRIESFEVKQKHESAFK